MTPTHVLDSRAAPRLSCGARFESPVSVYTGDDASDNAMRPIECKKPTLWPAPLYLYFITEISRSMNSNLVSYEAFILATASLNERLMSPFVF